MTRDCLIGYILHLKEREYASATVRAKVAAVKSFCHYLLHNGTILDDPAADSIRPRSRSTCLDVAPEDVERLLAVPGQQGDTPKALRDSALLEVLYATGMRVSELAKLTLDDVDPGGHGALRGQGKQRAVDARVS